MERAIVDIVSGMQPESFSEDHYVRLAAERLKTIVAEQRKLD